MLVSSHSGIVPSNRDAKILRPGDCPGVVSASSGHTGLSPPPMPLFGIDSQAGPYATCHAGLRHIAGERLNRGRRPTGFDTTTPSMRLACDSTTQDMCGARFSPSTTRLPSSTATCCPWRGGRFRYPYSPPNKTPTLPWYALTSGRHFVRPANQAAGVLSATSTSLASGWSWGPSPAEPVDPACQRAMPRQLLKPFQKQRRPIKGAFAFG